MRAERRWGDVWVRMSDREERDLMREIDTWPDPQVERDLVAALKELSSSA